MGGISLRRSARRIARAIVSLVIGAVWTAGAALASVSLELAETKVYKTDTTDTLEASPEGIFYRNAEGEIRYEWTPPPASAGPEGFEVTVAAEARGGSGGVWAAIGVSGTEFEFSSPQGIDFWASAGKTEARTQTVRARVRTELALGATITFVVGVGQDASVVYSYRVVAGSGAGLRVTEDCPDEIEISRLPSTLCHLSIDGFRRNTADPVQVILPDVIDGFGNHANGIQVLGAGEGDPANWDYPRSWDLLIFACPSQDNAGANCYGAVTTPGPVTVNVIVRQKGLADAVVPISFMALPHGGKAVERTVYIGARTAPGDFAQIAGGALAVAPVKLGTKAAQWKLTPAAGSNAVTICNVEMPAVCLAHVSGVLSDRKPTDPKAGQWTVEPVGVGSFVRFRNAAAPDVLIHLIGGTLAADPIGPDAPEGHWWLLD